MRVGRARLGVLGAASAAAVGVLAVGALLAPSGTAAPPTTRVLAATTFATSPGAEAPCTEGRSRATTVYTESFERGITESRFAVGFAASTASGAAAGSYAARASRPGSGTAAYFHLPYRQAARGAETRLAFAHRGNAERARNVVAVNSFASSFATSSRWTGTSFDITAATLDEDGWLGTWFQHNVTTGLSTYLAVDNVQIFTCRPNVTERIAGASRYETAALVAQRFAPGVRAVYIARGDNFPDALSASALGAAQDSPVLLTRTDLLPAATLSALQFLQPAEIVVLGNEGSVSAEVEAELAGYAPVVRRIGGSDRYETSALVSGEFPQDAPVALLSTGLNFADAMTGGALAGYRDGPLLLTTPDAIPDVVASELARLRPREIIVLGSAPTVSQAVQVQAEAYAPVVRRIAGTDRYRTAALISAEFPSSVSHTYLATGTNFPDGLTAGALAGSQGVPLLTSTPASLPTAVTERLRAIGEGRGFLLGMDDALSALVRDQYGRTLP